MFIIKTAPHTLIMFTFFDPLKGALFSYVKRSKARALLYLSTAAVYGRNFMRVSLCHVQGDPVHPQRSHHSFNPTKIIMTLQRAHLSQPAVDKECHLNYLKLLLCFSFKDGMPTLLISCSRDFIVSSTSKDTKIPKNPKITGALDFLV